MKQLYREAISRAESKLIEALDRAIANAEESGNTEQLELLRLERSELSNWHDPPQNPVTADEAEQFLKFANAAHNRMRKFYRDAVVHYTKQLDIETASRIQAAQQEWEDSLPSYVSLDNPSTAPQDALTRARNKQAKEFATIIGNLSSAIQRHLRLAANAGDLEKVKVLDAVVTELEANKLLTSVPREIVGVYNQYMAACRASTERLEAAYWREVHSAFRDDDDARYTQLMNELAQGVGVGPVAWTVLFRSSNPQLWNTNHIGEDGFVQPLDKAAEDTRYLRLRRMDNGAAVIIPMDRERLSIDATQGVLGWSGACKQTKLAYRLGIYRTDVNRQTRGMVVVGSEGFSPFTGWGFGTRHNIDDRQAYVWQGLEIKPTAFEIAVSSNELSSSETRYLLK
ncbi:MAG: hypothetical protein R3C53_26575 [Pirellulaceae bacterium]